MTDTYLGVASLAIVAISTSRWIRGIRQLEIPANRGLFVAVWFVAAGLGLAALLGEPGWVGGVPATLGVFVSSFFLMTVVIGGQKVGDGAVAVGSTIPDFTAGDEHGQTFDSRSLAGHPVLIKFFRGHW